METDVVVVAGLAAAVAARESGNGAIVFKKAAHTGGAANIGNGPFAGEKAAAYVKEL